jgi:hypothetical protein
MRGLEDVSQLTNILAWTESFDDGLLKGRMVVIEM